MIYYKGIVKVKEMANNSLTESSYTLATRKGEKDL